MRDVRVRRRAAWPAAALTIVIVGASSLVLPWAGPAYGVDGCATRPSYAGAAAGARALDEATDDASDETTEETSAEPTEETAEPTDEATEATEEPIDEATEEPIDEATEEPTDEATEEPTDEATEEPTDEATEEPTDEATEEPGDEATEEPTDEATEQPGDETTEEPTNEDAPEEVRQVTDDDTPPPPGGGGDPTEPPGDGGDDPGDDPGGDGDDPGSDPGGDGGDDEPAGLSIRSVANPQSVEQGGTLTISITVSNAGPGSDPGVVVNAAMPDGLEVVGMPDAYDPATGVWDVGSMNAGETITLVLVVEVTSSEDSVVAHPSVTGESTDEMVIDNEGCTLVEVEPPGSGDDTGDDPEVGEPGVHYGDPTEPGGDGDPSGDSTSPGQDDIDGSGATGSPGSADPDDPGTSADTESPDGSVTDPTDEATGGQASEQAAPRGDVPSGRTGSESALMLLGWMLLAGGVVLLLMGRMRRRTALDSATRS